VGGWESEEEGLLVDLTSVTLDVLYRLQNDELTACTEWVLGQNDRPRFNLGGSGPPGRAD
jgi:hypothetical protein